MGVRDSGSTTSGASRSYRGGFTNIEPTPVIINCNGTSDTLFQEGERVLYTSSRGRPINATISGFHPAPVARHYTIRFGNRRGRQTEASHLALLTAVHPHGGSLHSFNHSPYYGNINSIGHKTKPLFIAIIR